MFLANVIYFVAFFYKIASSVSETIKVKIENGEILGTKDFTIEQKKEYYAFKGIPYAEPPERFQLPEPKKNWFGVLDCTNDKSECVQGGVTVTGSEDCLFINVYTRNLAGNTPVVVWIHGGYFEIGNASYDSFGPDYFLDEDVIFVSLQYRLGIFGFISTGDLVAPGNLGFKDQALALKWIYDNIGYFGGDKNKITLFGQSAGAVGVSLHLQSEESRGYFNAAIMNSGTSLSLWSYSRRAVELTFNIGVILFLLPGNSQQLVEKLKDVDYQTLQKVSTTVAAQNLLEDPLAGIGFGAVKEPEHPTAFFTKNSDELLSQADFMWDIPVMMGVTSNEGIIIGKMTTAIQLYLLDFDIDSKKLVPAGLTDSWVNEESAASLIKDNFFDGKPVASMSENIPEFISADQWVRPSVRFAKQINKFQNNIYFYMFSYMGKLGGIDERIYDGVGHSEDLNYLFKTDVVSDSIDDDLMRLRLVRLWSNFVKYNNPTPLPDLLLQNQIWTPVDSISGTFKYFNINTTMEMKTNPYEQDLGLYDIIYKFYGKGVYDTY